jgi:hypothetical protein
MLFSLVASFKRQFRAFTYDPDLFFENLDAPQSPKTLRSLGANPQKISHSWTTSEVNPLKSKLITATYFAGVPDGFKGKTVALKATAFDFSGNSVTIGPKTVTLQ